MSYKATIALTGTTYGPAGASDEFYNETYTLEAETLGGVLDALVDKAYDMYFQVSLWLMEHRPADYSMEADSWYVNCSYPSLNNPLDEEDLVGSGSAISNASNFVQTVVHYRHMAVERFLKSNLNRVGRGRFESYTAGVAPLNKFYDIFHTDKISDFRNYGFTGGQLNRVIEDMGDEFTEYLKVLQRERGWGKLSERPIVIQKKTSEGFATEKSQSKPSLLKRLFFGARTDVESAGS